MRSILLILILGLTSFSTFGQSLEGGIEYFQNGELDQALEFFNEYKEQYPSESEAYFYIGRIYFEREDFDSSVKWFERALDRKNNDSKYHMWLGHGFGRRAQNASVLKQANLAKNSRKNYEKAIEIDPENVEARESAIEFYLQAPGFLGGGRDKAENQAYELESINVDAGIRAWGRIYTYYDEVQMAEIHYQSAIENHPESMVAYFSLFNFYFNEERYQDAIEIGNKQLALNDTTAAIYYNLGNAQSRSDLFDESINNYMTSLELDSTYYASWYQIGRVAAVSGEHLETGKEYIQKYIDIEGLSANNKSWAYFRLGKIQEHLNEIVDAKNSYETAISLNKDHSDAKEALASLD